MDSVLSYIGIAFLAYHGITFGLQVLNGIKAFILPSFGFKKNLKSSYGDWAVVTGCTDGIGKSYAKLLAKQGINIVLISRNLEKLQKVDGEIRSLYNVDTRIIVMDFGGGPEIYEGLEEKIKDLKIGILVNNVGVGDKCLDLFHEKPVQEYLNMLNVNILSVVMMTYIIIPKMVSRKKGLVINISSFAGSVPMPLIAVYSCTKWRHPIVEKVVDARDKVEEMAPTVVFVDFFSRSLDTEYSSKGIIVQCVMPAFVSTNMTKMQSSPFVLAPDAYVDQALGTVGLEKRTSGHWSHALQIWIFHNLIPGCLKTYLLWKAWSSIRDLFRKRRQKEKQKSGHKD